MSSKEKNIERVSLEGRTPFSDTFLFDLKGEVWREIEEYDGIYQLSNYGRVKSVARIALNGNRIDSKIMKQRLDKYSDPMVNLSKDKKARTFLISTLIKNTFLPQPRDGKVWLRKNRIKTDNRVVNFHESTISNAMVSDYATGRRKDHGIGLMAGMSRSEVDNELGTFENGKLVKYICLGCGQEKGIKHFFVGSIKHHRQKCNSCMNQIRAKYGRYPKKKLV